MTRTHVSLSAQADLFGRLYRKACKYASNHEDIRYRHTLYSCTMYGIPTSQRIANLIVWFEQRNLHHLMATVYRSWWHDDNKIISGYPHIVGYTVSIYPTSAILLLLKSQQKAMKLRFLWTYRSSLV